MLRHLSVALLAAAALTSEASARERNYTIRGEGWFDGANERYGRLMMREARLTLRDNGEFAVTLFVRNERYLVKGRWDRRGGNALERINIDNAFSRRASGSGVLVYRRNGDAPQRLQLEGRTQDGSFRAEISDGRTDGWNDRDRDSGSELGRGNRLYRDIDVTVDGSGILRLSGVRDGRLGTLRARMGTNRELRLEFDRPTRGTVRAEITDIRDNRIVARVTEVFGNRASGEIVVVMRDREMVERVNGSGGSDNGSWQLDFDGRSRGIDWDDRRERDSDWGEGRSMDVNERGNGWLRQDIGPPLSFDRMRVTLGESGNAAILLEGRRQSLRLRGRWTGRGTVVRIELSEVNERRARGQVELRRDGRRVQSLSGDGRTDMGRFEVRFTR